MPRWNFEFFESALETRETFFLPYAPQAGPQLSRQSSCVGFLAILLRARVLLGRLVVILKGLEQNTNTK